MQCVVGTQLVSSSRLTIVIGVRNKDVGSMNIQVAGTQHSNMIFVFCNRSSWEKNKNWCAKGCQIGEMNAISLRRGYKRHGFASSNGNLFHSNLRWSYTDHS